MKPLKHLNSALDRGAIKQIFDHVRNYLICAFVLAVGTTELRQQENQFFDLIPPGYAGLGVIFVAIVLISWVRLAAPVGERSRAGTSGIMLPVGASQKCDVRGCTVRKTVYNF